METFGSIASVIAAIRDDASAEVERLEHETVEIPREGVAVGDRDSKIAAAHRENRERIAQQEWEARRALVEQREAWITRVREAAHQRWDPQKSLTALAREALERIPGDECEIAVSCHSERSEESGRAAADANEPRAALSPRSLAHARDDKWLEDLAKATHKKLTITTAPIAGGCIVTSGGVAFDNSFEERAHRLEPEWRRALSALYKT